ncbi:MAG: hypothetical protein RLY86_4103 [Pseudomonadota bacterium]|jgi:outer membrane protein OmpA-like peptidoglycan-associated protein
MIRPMMRYPRPLLAGVALLALAACASAPETYPPLAALEQRFQQARADQVPADAPVQFREAEETLSRAQARLGEAEAVEMARLTQLAATRLDTAIAEAEAKTTREARETLLTDRQGTMLAERGEMLRRQEEELAMARQQLAAYEQRQTQQGLLVTLRDITFDLDSATISPGDQERLSPLAEYLRRNPDRAIVIEGHTDATGDAGYNMELSQQRADAVRGLLVSRGVDPARIRTVGRGPTVPVADNGTESGRLQNRRIEVMIENPSAMGSTPTGGGGAG